MACFLRQNKAIILINSEISELNDTQYIPDFIEGLENMGEIEEIIVKINSPGGSVSLGYAIFWGLVSSSKKITTELCGICASIAAIIFLAGTYRKSVAWGLYMLHQASGGDAKSLEKINESLQKILTPESFGNLDEIMANETWYNAEELLSMGIINEIIEVEKGQILSDKNENPDNQKKIMEAKAKAIFNIQNNLFEKEYAKELKAYKEEVEAITNKKNEDEPAEDPEKETEEETLDSLRAAKKAMEEEKEALTKAKADEEEMKTLKAENEKLAQEIEDLKSSMEKKAKDDEEKKKGEEAKAKLDLLIKNNISKELHEAWLQQPLSVMQTLLSTVNKKSPVINFSNENNASPSVTDFKNMTQEQKLEMYTNNPEQYAKLFSQAMKK